MVLDIARLTEVSEAWGSNKPVLTPAVARLVLDALPQLLREHELLKRCVEELERIWVYPNRGASSSEDKFALMAALREAGVLE